MLVKRASLADLNASLTPMEKQAFIQGLLAGAQRLARAAAPAVKNISRGVVADAKAVPGAFNGGLRQTAKNLAGNGLARNVASVAAGTAVGNATDSNAAGVSAGLLANAGLRRFARM